MINKIKHIYRRIKNRKKPQTPYTY